MKYRKKPLSFDDDERGLRDVLAAMFEAGADWGFDHFAHVDYDCEEAAFVAADNMIAQLLMRYEPRGLSAVEGASPEDVNNVG